MYTDENYNDFDENTELDNATESTVGENANKSAEATQPQQGQHGVWKKVSIGTTTGIVFGTIATSFANAIQSDGSTEEEEATDETATDTDATANPLVDSHISMASSVNNDMSFSQAFASARAEVGSGGVFEWHGNLYSTYTAEEWNNMSSAEHADYNTHFAWSSHENSGGHHTPHHDTYSDTQSDVAVNAPAEYVQVEEVVGQSDVEVLGVVHNSETGANYGDMLIDGQEAILVDVDGDGTFDVAVTDITQENITVDELEALEGFNNIENDQADITTDDNGMMYDI